jgi:signal peptidase
MDDGMKEILKYGAAFIVLIGIFYGGSFILKGILGTEFPMMVVVSQSMVPNLGVGDYIFVKSIENFDNVIAGPPSGGDILVFLRPGSRDEYIVHRAIEKKYQSSEWVFVTKGDNNAFADGLPVPQSNVIGKVVNRLPLLGYFSLFIKTMKGFGLVAVFMAISFFFEYISPKTTTNNTNRFNLLSLIPFLPAVFLIPYQWLYPNNHLFFEYIALIGWYIGCITLPLSIDDDDMGLMIWLYHLVLLIIPIACDMVWWTTGITPSNWWFTKGSTVPITWLLIEETPVFQKAFIQIMGYLTPGTLIFLFSLYAKRKEWEPFISLSYIFQGIKHPHPSD